MSICREHASAIEKHNKRALALGIEILCGAAGGGGPTFDKIELEAIDDESADKRPATSLAKACTTSPAGCAVQAGSCLAKLADLCYILKKINTIYCGWAEKQTKKRHQKNNKNVCSYIIIPGDGVARCSPAAKDKTSFTCRGPGVRVEVLDAERAKAQPAVHNVRQDSIRYPRLPMIRCSRKRGSREDGARWVSRGIARDTTIPPLLLNPIAETKTSKDITHLSVILQKRKLFSCSLSSPLSFTYRVIKLDKDYAISVIDRFDHAYTAYRLIHRGHPVVRGAAGFSHHQREATHFFQVHRYHNL